VLLFVLFCVVLSIVFVYICTVLLPPGGCPIEVKYIIYHITYHIVYHIITQQTLPALQTSFQLEFL